MVEKDRSIILRLNFSMKKGAPIPHKRGMRGAYSSKFVNIWIESVSHILKIHGGGYFTTTLRVEPSLMRMMLIPF